jgi:transposase
MTNESVKPLFVGIDAAKDSLQVALSDKAQSMRFDNNEQGVQALVQLLQGQCVALVALPSHRRS